MASATAAAAATRLQDLVRSFVSHDYDHGVKKMVADSCTSNSSSQSYVVALDAAEVLAQLPFYAASLSPAALSWHGSSRGVSSSIIHSVMVSARSSASVTEAAASQATFTALLRYLGSKVELYLRAFAQDVWTGPLVQHDRCDDTRNSSRSCSSGSDVENNETDFDSTSSDGGVSAAAAAAACASSGDSLYNCDGGHRVNFIAWMTLEVYRHLMAEAEAAALEGGGGNSTTRQNAYKRWEVSLREQLIASTQTASDKSAKEEVKQNASGLASEALAQSNPEEAAPQFSFEPYYDADDTFTNEPHFFGSFVREHLLPFMANFVRDNAKVDKEDAALADELRQWVRCGVLSATPTTPTSVLRCALVESTKMESTTEGKTGAELEQRDMKDASSHPNDQQYHDNCHYYFQRLVQLLLGPSAVLALQGENVYEASGLLRPHTPAEDAAHVAAAAILTLMPDVLQPATQWLDKVREAASAAAGGERGRSGGHPVSAEHQIFDQQNEECVEAVRRALDTSTRSLQVVPLPLCDGRDVEQHCETQLAGGWLMPPASGAPGKSMHVQQQDTYTQRVGRHHHHRALLLPGLSIAATRIRSLGADAPLVQAPRQTTQHSGGGERGGVTPDTATPPGTVVISPAQALPRLLLTDAHLDAAPAFGTRHESASAGVRVLDSSFLHRAEWLLLFTELPSEGGQLESIRGALHTTAAEGLVVLVVQAAVAKATQTWVEEAWGTARRPVLLLSSVGRWGLQQLSLRFDVEPNTPATDPRALRGVRCLGSEGNIPRSRSCAGVAALLLQTHKYAPSVSLSSASSVGAASVRASRRQHIAYTELREHLLVVVGLVELPNSQPTEQSCLGSSAVPVEAFRKGKSSMDAKASPARPPGMSMFRADSTSSTSSLEKSSSCESDVDSSDRSNSQLNSGSISEESTKLTDATATSTRVCDLRRTSRWYGEASMLPPFPFVTCSVVLGGATATRGSQREMLYHFWCWWRMLLHRLVLPPPWSFVVARQGPCSANVAALRYLDSWIEKKIHASAQKKGRDAGTLASPRPQHLLDVLREALWSYELLATQQSGERGRLEEAWSVLQRWVAASDRGTRATDGATLPDCSAGMTSLENRAGCLNTDLQESAPWKSSVESWLEVHSAFTALGDCLDELCRTAVLVGGGGAEDAEGEVADGSKRCNLSFLPLI